MKTYNKKLAFKISELEVLKTLVIEIDSKSTIVFGAHKAGKLAKKIGFVESDCYMLETVFSELASNLYYHAGGGTMKISEANYMGRTAFLIDAIDKGNGIKDVAEALEGNSKNPHGLGIGLSVVYRNMNEFELFTTDKGTIVRAIRYLDSNDLI